MSPEDAVKHYENIKALEDEGYRKALERFHKGDLEGGIKAWQESGKMRGSFEGFKPATFNLGGVAVPGYEITYTGEDGETQVINTAQAMHDLDSYTNQVKRLIDAQKAKVADLEKQYRAMLPK